MAIATLDPGKGFEVGVVTFVAIGAAVTDRITPTGAVHGFCS